MVYQGNPPLLAAIAAVLALAQWPAVTTPHVTEQWARDLRVPAGGVRVGFELLASLRAQLAAHLDDEALGGAAPVHAHDSYLASPEVMRSGDLLAICKAFGLRLHRPRHRGYVALALHQRGSFNLVPGLSLLSLADDSGKPMESADFQVALVRVMATRGLAERVRGYLGFGVKDNDAYPGVVFPGLRTWPKGAEHAVQYPPQGGDGDDDDDDNNGDDDDDNGGYEVSETWTLARRGVHRFINAMFCVSKDFTHACMLGYVPEVFTGDVVGSAAQFGSAAKRAVLRGMAIELLNVIQINTGLLHEEGRILVSIHAIVYRYGCGWHFDLDQFGDIFFERHITRIEMIDRFARAGAFILTLWVFKHVKTWAGARLVAKSLGGSVCGSATAMGTFEVLPAGVVSLVEDVAHDNPVNGRLVIQHKAMVVLGIRDGGDLVVQLGLGDGDGEHEFAVEVLRRLRREGGAYPASLVWSSSVDLAATAAGVDAAAEGGGLAGFIEATVGAHEVAVPASAEAAHPAQAEAAAAWSSAAAGPDAFPDPPERWGASDSEDEDFEGAEVEWPSLGWTGMESRGPEGEAGGG